MTDIPESHIISHIVEPGASKVPSASNNDWHKDVYHPKEEFELEPEWQAICKVVKARDKHQCQSCRVKVGLTVHHIVPREEGGKDYPPNLITLCKYCHDEIEDLGLRNKLQIRDYKYNRKYIKQSPQKVTHEKGVRWQQWVYGGYDKPQ